ncbi:hypothetical protein NESM_000225900 [Novymonas esmeraldas]|uniref:Uncharacterized protein n=1 Tax=Novymonas esmeraldas TaxID=1808958 RepID=A0AAW0F5S9_9TRYP
MQRLTHGAPWRRPRRLTAALTAVSCAQSSARQPASTASPRDSGAEADDASDLPRRRGRSGKSDADVLLADIFSLGKKMADEQRRSRVSVPASQLLATDRKGATPSTKPAAQASEPALTPPLPSTPHLVPLLRRRTARRHPSTPSSTPPPPQTTPLPPPALPSHSPTFVLTPQHLQATTNTYGASDIAFTLEELENTLFSPSSEEAEVEAAAAGATEAAQAVASPPPPPASDAAPLSPSPPVDSRDVALDSEQVVASPSAAAPPVLTRAAPCTRTTPPTAAAPALAGQLLSAPVMSSPAPAPPAAAAAPVLRCRLRGTAVVVRGTRSSPTPRELLEALQEAVSFAESLPPLPQGPRTVRLEGDAAHSRAFLAVDEWAAVTSSADEHVAVQLLKERLLRRMLDGPTRGLRYVAELRAGEAEAPLVVRDIAAEVLLACTAYERCAAANGRATMSGAAPDDVRLSFSGIGVGLFPAPATVRSIARTVESMHREGGAAASLLPTRIAASGEPEAAVVMERLHVLPPALSAALLARETTRTTADAAVAGPQTSSAGALAALQLAMTRWWQRAVLRRRRDACPVQARTSACGHALLLTGVTAADVWRRLCVVILAADADDASTQRAVAEACESLPVWRCRRSYRAAASPAFAGSAAAAALPVVVDVTASSLQRTSVVDLASEVREQPTDVVLVLSEDIRLQQKLQFLASLHLTNTGDHHRVTVLLPGDPTEVAECVSLTRFSARLVPQLPHKKGGLSTAHVADPRWLHQLVEVSDTLPCTPTAPAAAGAASASSVTLAERYVTHVWRRPCVTTRSGTVGLELAAAVTLSWQRLATTATGPEFRHAHLAPLVFLPERCEANTDGEAAHPWWTMVGESSAVAPESASSSPTVLSCVRSMSAAWPATPLPSVARRSDSAPLYGPDRVGGAFLFVLDAGCQALLRRAVESPEQLNRVSIAALGLDVSAGGLVDVADRAAGDGVDTLVSAMEEAAAAHGISFASLPLLQWMAEQRLLLYQLTQPALDRYTRVRQNRD